MSVETAEQFLFEVLVLSQELSCAMQDGQLASVNLRKKNHLKFVTPKDLQSVIFFGVFLHQKSTKMKKVSKTATAFE